MERKRKLVTALQVKLLNPPMRALAARGLAPGVALLETIGRKSGEPRRTPVSNGLQRGTNTFWIVAEMGRNAAYVRNIEATRASGSACAAAGARGPPQCSTMTIRVRACARSRASTPPA